MAYDGTLKFDTKLDSSGFKAGLSSLGSIAKTGLKTAMTAIGAVSGALSAAGISSIKVGSDFEAGMSKVKAISGATGQELQSLTEKAKEMGAVTKFSAKDSADAFNYMAMAGWKASDMIDGIDGVMNLAAASGEDLATVSDIVTDSMTAFGLEASKSGHFADVLAKAASNSNTNVGMMGATFKYVAPLAGSLGYNIEDMATAIGLMANAGIKGEMAGTQLRATLSRMAKPTKDTQIAMDVLGLSLTDATGKMKPFNQIMKEMREGFAKLTPEQKATYAAMLGGQEAMSGLLAIVNASDDDFNKLSASINSADGAAKIMAETMQDNLAGAIEELKGSAETLGIEFYQSIQEPLKNAAKSGVDYVNRITDAFKNGGLQGAVAEAGNIFAEIATKAAEAAPKLIDAAVSFIKSFVNGIKRNKDKLIAAAKEIVFTIANALVSLLPKEVQAPVKEAVASIKESFSNGGLKNAINTIATILKNVGKVISNIVKVVLPPLTAAIDFLGNNLKWILPLVTGFFAAYKAYGFVTAATTAITAMTTATTAESLAHAASTGALTLKQAAVGVLTGEIGLATAAQWLWNAAMSANPIGAIITLVAGLSGGIGLLALSMDGCRSEDQKLSEQFAETTKAIEEETQAYKDQIEEHAKKAESDLAQIDYTQRLWKELQTLADESGNVQDKDRARAEFILGQLNDALGTEYEMTGNVIQNYKDIKSSIDDVINSKKAEILLNAHLEDYEAAIKSITDADKQRSDAEVEISKIQQKIAENDQKYKDDIEQLKKTYGENSEAFKTMMSHRKEGYETDGANLRIHLSEAEKAYAAAEDQYKTYSDNIQLYESAKALTLEGKTDEAVELLRRQSEAHLETAESVKGSLEDQQKALGDQVINLESYAQTLDAKFKAGVSGVTKEMVDDAKERADQAKEEFYKVGGNIIGGTEAGIQGKKWILNDSMNGIIYETVENAKKRAGIGGEEIGGFMGTGVDKGLQGTISKISKTAADLVYQTVNAAKHASDSHSPSRLFKREVGQNIGLGVAVGIDESKREVQKSAKGQIESIRNAYNGGLSGMVGKLRATLSSSLSKVSADSVVEANYTAYRSVGTGSSDGGSSASSAPKQVVTKINIDGREFAIATAPYIEEEIAFA